MKCLVKPAVLPGFIPGRVRLKATNERQDDGAGILHQVAQFPIDQVYLIYKAPMALSALTRPREGHDNYKIIRSSRLNHFEKSLT